MKNQYQIPENYTVPSLATLKKRQKRINQLKKAAERELKLQIAMETATLAQSPDFGRNDL